MGIMHIYGYGFLSTRWARVPVQDTFLQTHSHDVGSEEHVRESWRYRLPPDHQHPPQCPLCPCFAHWSLSTLPPTQRGGIIILILFYKKQFLREFKLHHMYQVR